MRHAKSTRSQQRIAHSRTESHQVRVSHLRVTEARRSLLELLQLMSLKLSPGKRRNHSSHLHGHKLPHVSRRSARWIAKRHHRVLLFEISSPHHRRIEVGRPLTAHSEMGRHLTLLLHLME